MKNILIISIILFSFIQSQIIWGQNTWVAKTKVEQGLIDYAYNNRFDFHYFLINEKTC